MSRRSLIRLGFALPASCAALLLAGSLAGCEDDSTEDAVDETADVAEDTADDAADALDDAADDVGDALDDGP
jgi:archaellum component FlaG (FlaF/FlaG flagellin family)